MSDPTRPWGPHGPTVPPNSVTPNPTSAWSEPSIGAPESSNQPTGGGGGSSFVIDWLFRPPKKYWLAVPLAWLFGPVGLLYAIGDSKPQWIALGIFCVVAVLAHLAPGAPINPRLHPIMMICAIWSIFATRAWNNRHK